MLGMMRQRITDRDTTNLPLNIVINLCLYRRVRNRMFCCYDDVLLFNEGKVHMTISLERIANGEIKEHPELAGLVECVISEGEVLLREDGLPNLYSVMIGLDNNGRVYEIYNTHDDKNTCIRVALPIEDIIQIASAGHSSHQFLLDNKGRVYIKDHGELKRLEDIPYITRMVEVEGEDCIYLVDGDNNFHRYKTMLSTGKVVDSVPNNKVIPGSYNSMALYGDELRIDSFTGWTPMPYKIIEIHARNPRHTFHSAVVTDDKGKVRIISPEWGRANTINIEGILFSNNNHIQELGQTLRVEWGTTTLIS